MSESRKTVLVVGVQGIAGRNGPAAELQDPLRLLGSLEMEVLTP
jgi:hypothetical protein